MNIRIAVIVMNGCRKPPEKCPGKSRDDSRDCPYDVEAFTAVEPFSTKWPAKVSSGFHGSENAGRRCMTFWNELKN